MSKEGPTLTAGVKPDEPYSWLAGRPGSGMPAEWLAALEAPEKNSIKITGSYDPDGMARCSAFIRPTFADPDYGALSLTERKFIGVIVSALNACPTCLIIHTNHLGNLIGDHGRARRIAINYRAVALSAQERAIADFSVKLTEQPGRMEQADVQRLLDVGVPDEKIYYIVETVAVFNLTNRMTAGYGMRPDEDFLEAIAPREPAAAPR